MGDNHHRGKATTVLLAAAGVTLLSIGGYWLWKQIVSGGKGSYVNMNQDNNNNDATSKAYQGFCDNRIPSDKVWRIGLVGLGAISHYYVNAIAMNKHTSLTAICDVRKPENMEPYGSAKYYSEYTKLIDDPAVDVVVIATPPNMHVPIIEYAASKKKKIITEKPIATSAEDCQKAKNATLSNKTHLYFAYHAAFAPTYQKAKAIIDKYRQENDTITSFNVLYREDVRAYHHQASWIFKKSVSGGGCLIDSGINAISVVEDCIGTVTPTKVSISSEEKYDVETKAEVDFVLARDRNVTGHLSMDWLWTGTEARRFDFVFQSGRKVAFNLADGTVGAGTKDSEISMEHVDDRTLGVDEANITPMSKEYENLLSDALALFHSTIAFNPLSDDPFTTIFKCLSL